MYIAEFELEKCRPDGIEKRREEKRREEERREEKRRRNEREGLYLVLRDERDLFGQYLRKKLHIR